MAFGMESQLTVVKLSWLIVDVKIKIASQKKKKNVRF